MASSKYQSSSYLSRPQVQVPLFKASIQLAIPNIVLKPSLEDIQVLLDTFKEIVHNQSLLANWIEKINGKYIYLSLFYVVNIHISVFIAISSIFNYFPLINHIVWWHCPLFLSLACVSQSTVNKVVSIVLSMATEIPLWTFSHLHHKQLQVCLLSGRCICCLLRLRCCLGLFCSNPL